MEHVRYWKVLSLCLRHCSSKSNFILLDCNQFRPYGKHRKQQFQSISTKTMVNITYADVISTIARNRK